MKDTLKRITKKFKYSFLGFWTAFKEEKSLWTLLLISVILIVCAFIFKISLVEWAIMILGIFLVFTIEIINTALEAAVDTISFQYNVKVKKIKDIASGATMVIIVGVIIILLIIFIPAIKETFNG